MMEPEYAAPVLWLFCHGDDSKRLSDIFKPEVRYKIPVVTKPEEIPVIAEKLPQEVPVFFKTSERELHVVFDKTDDHFLLDTKEGIIKRKSKDSEMDVTDSTVGEDMIVKKFVIKNGFFFPTLIKQDRLLDHEEGNLRRIVIEEDSIEINKKYLLSDFSVTIPVGVKIFDEPRNAHYVTEQPISLIDVKNFGISTGFYPGD